MDHHGVSSLKVDGKLITDPKMKAEALNKQFKSVFVNETDFVSQPSVPRFPSMPQIIFPSSTVLKLLQDLNPAKASGPDNLSPRVLKEISSQIAVPLAVVSKNL